MTLRFGHITDYEQVIYMMWLWGEIDNGNVPDFGFSDELIREAFSYAQFTGPVRPDIDPMKSAKAHEVERKEGWKSGAMIAAERGGQDFDENIKRLKIENEALADANQPLVEQDKTSYSFSKAETESKTVSETLE
jgi:capsid protein